MRLAIALVRPCVGMRLAIAIVRPFVGTSNANAASMPPTPGGRFELYGACIRMGRATALYSLDCISTIKANKYATL